jgi:hypothetical protein
MKAGLIAAAVLLAVSLTVSAQHTYAFYYNLVGGRELEINVMNTEDAFASCSIEAHDAWGDLLWFDSFDLSPLMSSYFATSDHVPSNNWGVVVVTSDTRLVIGLEYFDGGSLVSIDNVYVEAPEIAAGLDYWSGAYYTLAGGAETSIVLLNPWSVATLCKLIVHEQGGEILYEQDFVFDPYEGFYVSLDDYISAGPYAWGFADVLMLDSAVILAVEYHNRGCAGLEIDNISSFYY